MSPGLLSDKSGGGGGGASWNNSRQQRDTRNVKQAPESTRKEGATGSGKGNPAMKEELAGKKPEELLLEKLPSFFDTDEDLKMLLLKKLEQCLVVLDIPIGYTLNMSIFQNNNSSNIGGNQNNSGMFMNKKGGLLKMGSTTSLFDSLGDGMGSGNIRRDFMLYNKIVTLQEIRDFLRSSPSGIYTKDVCMAIIEVVKTNIFRITVKNEMQSNTDDEFGGLVPISVSNDSGNTIDVTTTTVEYSWDILLRMVISPQFTDKTALELLSANFLTELIESMINMSSNGNTSGASCSGSGSGSMGSLSGLGGSGGGGNNGGLGCPQNECEYAKTVLHRLYAKYMPMRNILRLLISSALKEMSEYQATSSTTFNPLALLDVLSSIVNGYTTPLKQEHINMLSNVLLPLHKNLNLVTYHTQLVSVIKVFVQKDPSLIVLVLNKVIEMYPKIDSSKEILFITEIGDFVDISNHSYLKPIFGKVIELLCLASMSQNIQVAEKALSTLEKDSVFSFIRDSPNQYGATVLLYLQMNKTHWAFGIQNSTQRVTDKIIKAISGSGGYYNQQQSGSKVPLDKMTVNLVQRKQVVVNEKITKEATKEAGNAKFWSGIDTEVKNKVRSLDKDSADPLSRGRELRILYDRIVDKFRTNPLNPMSIDWIDKHNALTRMGSGTASTSNLLCGFEGINLGEKLGVLGTDGDQDGKRNPLMTQAQRDALGSDQKSQQGPISALGSAAANLQGSTSKLIPAGSKGLLVTVSNNQQGTSSTSTTAPLGTTNSNTVYGTPASDPTTPTNQNMSMQNSQHQSNSTSSLSVASAAAAAARSSPLISSLKSSASPSGGSLPTHQGQSGSQLRPTRRKSVTSTSGHKQSTDAPIVERSMSTGVSSSNDAYMTSAADPLILTHNHHGVLTGKAGVQAGMPVRYTHSSSGNPSSSQLSVPPMDEYPGQGVIRIKKKKKTKRRLNYVNETGNILLAPMTNGY